MRPWIEWSASIGLAATCLMFTGCGVGDVADPGSDHSAAADSASDIGEPPAPAPAGGGKAAPVVAQNKGRAVSAPKEDADADADDKKDAAQASSENPSATKSEGGSATAEMLAMATGGQTGSGGAQPPAGGGAAPGQNPQPGGGAQAPAPPSGMGGYAEAMRAQAGRQANQSGGQAPQPGVMGAYAEAMRARGGGGGPAGYPTGPGGAGLPGGNAQGGYPGGSAGAGAQGAAGLAQDNGPADTRSPEGAVRAFLNALQTKDRDHLAEATALRSQTEASTDKTKELFGRIVDLSISDAEIDDLAKKLQGFHIAGENAPKSTGRLGIYIDKPTAEGSVLRVTLTVRKEKKGWGVMDMSSNPIEFKPMGNMNQRRKASGRG
ncbi:MAG: hypothetical protein ACXVBO_12345 [Isosphaeraceae bacterium]